MWVEPGVEWLGGERRRSGGRKGEEDIWDGAALGGDDIYTISGGCMGKRPGNQSRVGGKKDAWVHSESDKAARERDGGVWGRVQYGRMPRILKAARDLTSPTFPVHHPHPSVQDPVPTTTWMA